MPPPPGERKKKKGRKPAHQNTFAFRHNPKSKLTDKILASPNEGVCKKCYDKIEWRKQYRKYKPLSQPARCNLCKKRNIKAAYHTICNGCATSETVIKKMLMGRMEERRAAEERREAAVEDKDENVEETNELGHDEVEDSDNPAAAEEETKCRRVCAICCKARAMKVESDGTQAEREIERMKAEMEVKLGRPLKLRESTGIERKVHRGIEKKKQAAKEERRRLREEGMRKDANDQDGGDGEQQAEDDANVEEEVPDTTVEKESETNDDEEEDPFLKAVGGQDKLLTGEAYQKMMLEREKQ